MSKHCEECQALTILLENGLISDDAYVSDCPDIRSFAENIEVMIATPNNKIGKIENQMNFGSGPKENEYTDPQEYNCNDCEFIQKCKEYFECDCPVCEKCKDKYAWLKSSFGGFFHYGKIVYVGKSHPESIGLPLDFYGLQEDIENAIRIKEEKSQKYQTQTTGLFLFYDKEISKIKPITSDVFENIYIFCIDSGNLYKNWNLIKTYRHSGYTNCYNTECDEYGKFNN